MLKPIFLSTLLLSLSSWGSSWGMPSKALVSQMAVVCYSGGKVIFQDESISDFIKPTQESETWTFIIRSKKIKVHITGNCIVYEADKNSTYPMPISNEEVKLGSKTPPPNNEESTKKETPQQPTPDKPSSDNDIVFSPNAKDTNVEEEPLKAKHGEKIINPSADATK